MLNSRNAVGPSEGNSDGVSVVMATAARIPIVSNPLKKANAPMTSERG